MARLVDPSDIVPESVELIVEEDAEATTGRPTVVGGPGLKSSLGAWRAKLGGDSGPITDPLGRSVTVSLEPWIGRDPETTYVRVYFKYRRYSKIGTKRP